jgi:hypothetical protein
MFGAVLCPRCGFSGDSDLFSHGCPACGYLEENQTPEYPQDRRNRKSLFSWPRLSPLFYMIGIVVLVSLIFYFITLL